MLSKSLGWIVATIAAIVVMAQPVGAQNIIYVDASADPGGNGTSWAQAYTDVQDALGRAGPSVQIWIAAGTYTPDRGTGIRESTYVLPSGVSLIGGFDGTEVDVSERDLVNNLSILSGEIGVPDDLSDNIEHIVTSNNTTSSAIIDGIVFERAKADRFGGGVHTRSGNPTIVNCTFRDCHAYAGGGIFARQGNPLIQNCIFENNETVARGAGVYLVSTDATVRGCTFRFNHCHEGGSGLHIVSGTPIIEDCFFNDNTSNENGGAMYNIVATPIINRCTFINNSSINGAAYMNDSGLPILTDCIFRNNIATGSGGAVYIGFGFPEFRNCLFENNSAAFGGGVYNEFGFPILYNCTLSGNTATTDAGGLYDLGLTEMQVYNSIIWGNSLPSISGPGIPIVQYSCVEGGWAGDGNIDADPLFNPDLSLQIGSPAIDAANNVLVPDDLKADLGNHIRLTDEPATADTGLGLGALSDMGAFEVPSDRPQMAMDRFLVGETTNIEVRGCLPQGNVWVFYSLNGPGQTFVPSLNVTLDMLNPVELTNPRAANSEGVATFSLRIPNQGSGLTVRFQAAQLKIISNVFDATEGIL